ncbi:MAG: hypothetical protein ACKOSS_07150 [Planctomycetia bacterium]
MGRTPAFMEVKVDQRAVWGGATALSLPQALLALGLIPREAAVGPAGAPAPGTAPGCRGRPLRRWAQARWGGSVEALLAEAAGAGRLDLAALDARHAPRGALIGWAPTSEGARGGQFRLCTDLALTVLVLERQAGALYLGSRRPERSWERLFGTGLVVDDPRVRGASLAEVLPWAPEADPGRPEGEWTCW